MPRRSMMGCRDAQHATVIVQHGVLQESQDRLQMPSRLREGDQA